MGTVRVRVVFEEHDILNESQRLDGLEQSWLVVKPPLETIRDLSFYLGHTFAIYQSCPNGIILSMDGFVFPPFESTSILKDNDVIRVKKKEGVLPDIVEVGNGANLIEEEKIVEKQPVLTSVPLLANEEFAKETGGYQSKAEEDDDEDTQLEATLQVENSTDGNVVSKKRKASEKHQSSKRKKRRSMDPENNFDKEKESCEFHPGKTILKKKEVSALKRQKSRSLWCSLIGTSPLMSNMLAKWKNKASSVPRSSERNNDNLEPFRSPKRSGQLENDGAGSIQLPQIPDGTRKVPSRSARRKKSKRKWLKELKAEMNELANMQLHQNQSPEMDTHKSSVDDQRQNLNSEANSDTFPIVIRPGHIRFEPLEGDEAVEQTPSSMIMLQEIFQWNGITSKKKGQKWGKEKFPFWKKDYKDFDRERSETITTNKVETPNDLMDFDKLAPFTSWPREGDVIAYRLLELSSTWTPVLSPFRVGKTCRYEPQSNTVLLTPLPEYPITFEKPDEDASAQQPDDSLYREDGSLEIDFSLLVDVRTVKQGVSVSAATGWVNNVPVGNEVAVTTGWHGNNAKQTDAPPPGKEMSVWDQFSQALSAKKTQLIQENGWSNWSSGRSPWSYRALRGKALGPTMASLRARNRI